MPSDIEVIRRKFIIYKSIKKNTSHAWQFNTVAILDMCKY